MEFKDLKIGETYVHGNIIFIKKNISTGMTFSGIPFFMNPYDKVEIYTEEKYENEPNP